MTLSPSSPSYASIPSGQRLGNPPVYYDISTTAGYSGSILVCLTYPAGSYSINNPSLLHYSMNSWIDITSTADTSNHEVCGSVTSFSPFAVTFSDNLPSSSSGDPHLVGAMGVQYDFDGQPDGKYVLFSTPQFQVAMTLSGEDGPGIRFMTEIGLLFRNQKFDFGVTTMSLAFRDDLETRLAQVGGKLIAWSSWETKLELCTDQLITIRQMHSVGSLASHADGTPWYFLDVDIILPGCHDDYDGALGQTYKCKYVQGEEEFVWSHAQEASFQVPDLFTPTGRFRVDAECGDSQSLLSQNKLSASST